MAFEPARLHDFIPFPSNAAKIIPTDDASGYHITGGVDVPSVRHSHHFPGSPAPFSPFLTEYSPPDLPPPRLWSFTPVVDSPTYSTETESNEEDDDFMAGLAKQMTHLMLENDDEGELDSPVDAAGTWTANWSPVTTKPCPDQTHSCNSNWRNDGWRNSNSPSKVKAPFLSKCSSADPDTVQEDVFLLYSAKEGTSACERKANTDSLSTQISRESVGEELVARKIEEFLWRQAFTRAAHSNTHLPKDPPRIHYGSKSKPSYGSRMHRMPKLQEEDRKTYNSQGRYSRHTQPVGARHIRPQQRHSIGQINIQTNPAIYQHCAKVIDPATPSWISLTNLSHGPYKRAVFPSRNTHARESAGTGVFLPRSTTIDNDTKTKSDHSPTFTSSNEAGFSLQNSRAVEMMEFYTRREYAKPYTSSHIHQPSEAALSLPVEWTY